LPEADKPLAARSGATRIEASAGSVSFRAPRA
jgi:hypothetical protein